MENNQNKISQVSSFIKNSNNILFFTGAGISTDSGIPDFRGPNGVWKQRQPVYYQDFMISEKARIEYWNYKLEWWEKNRDAKPNAVHDAIHKLESAKKVLMVVTQNIDGLHKLSGIPAQKIVELHGTNWEVECQSCKKRSEPGPHFDFFIKHTKAPICTCRGFLKPATISFGQNLCESDIERASEAAKQADSVIALGSTLSVYPAASFPLQASARGIPYMVLNHGATDHDGLKEVALRIDCMLSDVFPQAVDLALES